MRLHAFGDGDESRQTPRRVCFSSPTVHPPATSPRRLIRPTLAGRTECRRWAFDVRPVSLAAAHEIITASRFLFDPFQTNAHHFDTCVSRTPTYDAGAGAGVGVCACVRYLLVYVHYSKEQERPTRAHRDSSRPGELTASFNSVVLG